MRLSGLLVAMMVGLVPVAALGQAAAPSVATLTSFEREAASAVCARSGDTGSTLWTTCMDRQVAALAELDERPALHLLKHAELARAEAFCKTTLATGAASWYRCMSRQVAQFVPPALRARAAKEQAMAEAKPVEGLRTMPGQTTVQPLAKSPQPASLRAGETNLQAMPGGDMEMPASTWSAIAPPDMPRRIATERLDPSDLFDRVARSVYTTLAARNGEDLKALQDVVQASAVAVTPNLLVTNCHAVKDRPYVMVVQNGQHLNAAIQRADMASDRCFLQLLEGKVQPVAGVRPYDSLKVGERVYAIGSPRGVQQTLSEGLIGGKARNPAGMKLIQAQAPTAPGSSGGGLFDASGNLIGIVSFALPDREQWTFAIGASEFWR
jgi:hypothetical protein